MSEKTPNKAKDMRQGKRPGDKNIGRKRAFEDQWKPARRKMEPKTIAWLVVLCVAAMGIGVFTQLDAAKVRAVNEEFPLRISEVMTGNGVTLIMEDGSLPDWIEIENTSEAPVALSGWSLMIESDPTRVFAFSTGTLQPGEQVIVCADNNVSARGHHAPFKLSASGETIALLDKNGSGADMVEVPEMDRDQAWARDVAGSWKLTDRGTPGTVNRIEQRSEGNVVTVSPGNSASGDVRITEVMSGSVTWFADENGLCHDYIEICNTSSRAISLKGWYLTDSVDKLFRWQFPDVSIPAGGYLAVHCSGLESRGNADHLHAGFRLSSDGNTIVLTDNKGVSVDVAHVPALEADQSYSLRNGAWTADFPPTPGMANSYANAAVLAEDSGAYGSGPVVITEVMANASASHDWIEIHNGSNQAVDISGWGLSNNTTRPRKWQFPAGTVLQPGAYMGVFASGLDAVSGNAMHTNFRLATAGGYTLSLADTAGNILDRVYMPAQYTDVSFGRLDGYSGFRYLETPTPAAPNGGASWAGRANGPAFSVQGGLFKKGDVFTVSISAAPGQKIYYTLDYTDPDENSTLYTEPITVSDTTILRARVYEEDMMPSFMDSRSYLYDVKNADGKVYVVSLVSDPYNLTSNEAGILVDGGNNPPNYMQNWEREAHVEVFDNNGGVILSQECCVRQQGQTSRADPQQSLKLIARSQYGDNMFRGSLFRKRDYTEYKSFMLRTSNDDSGKTRMRDSVLSGLADTTGLVYQETEVCVAYINGAYWGHYNMRETINTHSICQHEGWVGQEDAIDFVIGNDAVAQGSNKTFDDLLKWLKKNDPSTDEAYRMIDSVIDIQNYIEYMVIEMYVGNTDPSDIKRYRNPKADGKWRWALFDLDWAFIQDTNSVRRWLTPGGMGNGNRTDNRLFIACMKNKTFRDQFLTHMGQQMVNTFTDELYDRLEARYTILKEILPDHYKRFDGGMSAFNKYLKRMVEYAHTRPKRMLSFIKYNTTLNLSQAQMEKYFGEAMKMLGYTYDKIPRI